jgi:hypothetical protein
VAPRTLGSAWRLSALGQTCFVIQQFSGALASLPPSLGTQKYFALCGVCIVTYHVRSSIVFIELLESSNKKPITKAPFLGGNSVFGQVLWACL